MNVPAHDLTKGVATDDLFSPVALAPAAASSSTPSPRPADIVARFLDQADELAWLRDRVRPLECQRQMDLATIEGQGATLARQAAQLSRQSVQLARADETIADLRAVVARHEAERARRPVPYEVG